MTLDQVELPAHLPVLHSIAAASEALRLADASLPSSVDGDAAHAITRLLEDARAVLDELDVNVGRRITEARA